MYDFAIIGAGYGGLSAAALLSRKGYSVVVLERAGVAGGRSAYFEKDGFIWQYGQHSHRLERDGHAAGVFSRLGIPLIFNSKSRKKARIFYKGRLYERPEGLAGVLKTQALSLKERLIFLRIFINILRAEPAEWYDRTLLEFYRTLSDDPGVRRFLSFLGFTVMLPDAAAVSAGEVIDFVQRAQKARVKQGEPACGAKQVIDKLTDFIAHNGGEIMLNADVKKIIVKNKTAAGVVLKGKRISSRNVVYAAPLNGLFKIADKELFNRDFVYYCKNIESSSGVVIDFVSAEPLADIPGGILGVDEPLWVKFQTLIDPSVAPPGRHVCTWGLLNRRGRISGSDFIATEKRLREIAQICMPGYERKVTGERKLYIPVVNANILIPAQSRPFRPDFISADVSNLYFAGDTTRGEGCSGDIAFSSALKLDDLIK